MEVPVQMLRDTSDNIVTLSYGRRFAAAIPTTELLPIEATSHFPQLEQQDAVTAFATLVQ